LTVRSGRRKSIAEEEPSKRQERAERILNATAELVMRWGYRKTTIDDIAKLAGVGKGTIYLHWKTREDLFLAMLIRERLRATNGIEQRIAQDPEGMTLHGMIKHALLATMSNPLLKAALLRDTEVLGELVKSDFGRQDIEQRFRTVEALLGFFRSKKLIRTDIGVREQLQMLSAITTGFLMLNQFLPDEYHISDEEMAQQAAEAVQRIFELRNPTPTEQDEVATTYDHILEHVREQAKKELES